jgi:hypothetical protein
MDISGMAQGLKIWLNGQVVMWLASNARQKTKIWGLLHIPDL